MRLSICIKSMEPSGRQTLSETLSRQPPNRPLDEQQCKRRSHTNTSIVAEEEVDSGRGRFAERGSLRHRCALPNYYSPTVIILARRAALCLCASRWWMNVQQQHKGPLAALISIQCGALGGWHHLFIRRALFRSCGRRPRGISATGALPASHSRFVLQFHLFGRENAKSSTIIENL